MTRKVVSKFRKFCESYARLAVLKLPVRRNDSATPSEGLVPALMAVRPSLVPTLAFSTSRTMASRFILSDESSLVAAPRSSLTRLVTVRVSSCTPILPRLGWRRV